MDNIKVGDKVILINNDSDSRLAGRLGELFTVEAISKHHFADLVKVCGMGVYWNAKRFKVITHYINMPEEE